jgi:hypothetical protein
VIKMYDVVHNCRICGSPKLLQVISLGDQVLTGVFPKTINEDVTKGPLDLIWCDTCGLLQMKQSYSLDEMYGDNYGYRSGLNTTMIQHLTSKIRALETLTDLQSSDLVIDIGSNDATSLKAYSTLCTRVGIDPTGIKFKEYYPYDVTLIPDFFTAEKFKALYKNRKAKIITSVAMFYDLENPAAFVKDIRSIIADDGVWHIEQSYMASMLNATAYDMICHEHLEFYSLAVLNTLMAANGMRVFDVQTNSINGGSLALNICKDDAPYETNDAVKQWMLRQEHRKGLGTFKPYREFAKNIQLHRTELKDLITSLNDAGKTVFGYGASTKGNVMLQYCGFTSADIPYIAEVNEDKFGCYTPGTNIPIISETAAKAMNPDYYLVLPWPFKNNILAREQEYIRRGGKFIFPLPEIEII